VVTKSYDVRDNVRDRLQKCSMSSFRRCWSRVEPLQLGPPVDWPIQYRVAGSDIGMVRAIADQVSTALRSNLNTRTINLQLVRQGRSVLVTVDQEKARLVGMTSEQVAKSLNDVLSGRTVTQLRDDIYLVDVRGRAVDQDRRDLGALRDLEIRLPNGNSAPLAQIAAFPMGSRSPRGLAPGSPADYYRTGRYHSGGFKPRPVNQQLASAVDKIRSSIPPGYRLEDGGAVEQSAKAKISARGDSHHVHSDAAHSDGSAAKRAEAGDRDAHRTARTHRRHASPIALAQPFGLSRCWDCCTHRHDHPQFVVLIAQDQANENRRWTDGMPSSMPWCTDFAPYC